MKKKNLICAVISNAAIICLIAILFFVCNPLPSATAASSPVYSGDREGGRVALMFNVYEGSANVEKILDILEKNRITCTFFVGGIWVERNEPLLIKMSERAEIGNHGYLHLDHASLSYQRNREEILLCHNLVEKVCGIEMNLFAPPSGSFGDVCLDVCKENDYRVIMWSKDTIDWRDKDYQVIFKRATSDVRSGDLILMHPTDQTVLALPLIIDAIKAKNLDMTTVSEVLDGSEEAASRPGGIIRRLTM